MRHWRRRFLRTRASARPRPVRRARRAAVLAVPVVVPISMRALFNELAARLPPATAYNLGFAAYWGLWCCAFPVWVLGPRRAAAMLSHGRRPTRPDAVLLTVPVIGAVGAALIPNVRRLDGRVIAVMVSTAGVNSIGEELLWRGVFVDEFPGDPVLGVWWPLLGFSLWHLAPQSILSSSLGRWRFVGGAALVGLGSAVTTWRAGGSRHTLVPHFATDACGVRAAEFRLGR